MNHVVSRDLHRYWDKLRAGRTAPERRDIDPAAIRHVLAHTFVLAVSGGNGARDRSLTFRLSGTRTDALFARDLRGSDFGSLWAEGTGGLMEAVLDGVLDGRCPVVAGVRGGPPGHPAIDLELLLLPLRHHGRTHARLLGSLATAAAPGWLGLRPSAGLDIVSFRTLVPRSGDGRLGCFGQAGGEADRGEAPLPSPAIPPSAPAGLGPVPAAAMRVGRFTVHRGGREAAPL